MIINRPLTSIHREHKEEALEAEADEVPLATVSHQHIAHTNNVATFATYNSGHTARAESILASKLAHNATYLSRGILIGAIPLVQMTNTGKALALPNLNFTSNSRNTWISYMQSDAGEAPFIGATAPELENLTSKATANEIQLKGLGNVADVQLQLCLWHHTRQISELDICITDSPCHSLSRSLPLGQLSITNAFKILGDILPSSGKNEGDYTISYAVKVGKPPIEIETASGIANAIHLLEKDVYNLYQDIDRVHFDLRLALWRFLIAHHADSENLLDFRSKSCNEFMAILHNEFIHTTVNRASRNDSEAVENNLSMIHNNMRSYGDLLTLEFDKICSKVFRLSISDYLD